MLQSEPETPGRAPFASFGWAEAISLFGAVLVVLGAVAWGGGFVDNAKHQDARIDQLEGQVKDLQDMKDRLTRIEAKVDLLTPSQRPGDR